MLLSTHESMVDLGEAGEIRPSVAYDQWPLYYR
jgi:hypothetical protein